MVERQTECAGVKIQFSVFSFQKLDISFLSVRDSGDSFQIQRGLKRQPDKPAVGVILKMPGRESERKDAKPPERKENKTRIPFFLSLCIASLRLGVLALRLPIIFCDPTYATRRSVQVRCDVCGKADLPPHRPKHRVEPTAPFPKSVFRL